MLLRSIVKEFGEPSKVVQLDFFELPELSDNFARIKILASAINPSDQITISGAYSTTTSLPFLPGYEGVGVVTNVGRAVTSLKPGDRVIPIGSAGNWQEMKDVDPDWCLKVPESLTNNQAAMSYINPMTAWIMLHKVARINSGMRVAINAAGSAIGKMMIMMMNATGIKPIAFVRSLQTANSVADMCELTICADTDQKVFLEIEKIWHKGQIDVMFDCVGGVSANLYANLLRQNGQFVHYGLLSGQPIPSSFFKARPDIHFKLFHLRNWIRREPLLDVHQVYAHVTSLIAAGTIGSQVRNAYPLNEINAALKDASNLTASGKVTIIPCAE